MTGHQPPAGVDPDPGRRHRMTARECSCWVDDDPVNGFIDARDCPLHGDDVAAEADAEAYAWWRSQQ